MEEKANINLGLNTYWNSSNNTVIVDSLPVKLSTSMTKCMKFLIENRGRQLASKKIFYYLWGTKKPFNNKAIRSLISTIRKRIPTLNILNYYGGFYSLEKYRNSIPAFQDYLLDFIDQAKNGIVITDPNQIDNPIIYVNDAFVDIFGYSSEEVIGFNCRFLQGKDKEQDEIKKIREAIAEEKEISVIIKNYHKTGRLIYNEIQISPIFDKKSLKLKHFLGVQKDVTDLITYKKQLERNIAYQRPFLDNLPFLIWLKDKDSKFISVNKAFAEATNLNDPEKLIGKTDFDVWPEKLANDYVNDDKEIIRKEEAKTVIEEVMDKDSIKYFETFKSPVFDTDKNLLGSMGYAIDISNKLNNERILRNNNEQLEIEKSKLHLIIHSLPDPLWIKDKDGIYLACNKRFEDFFGHKEEEIIGKTDYDFVDKDLADLFRKNDKKAIKSSTPISNFETLPFKDGHLEYVQTTKTKVVLSDGTIYGILGIARDITLQKKKEDIIKSQRKEFETVFNYSHDSIAITDLDANFLSFNKAFLELTGFSRDELLSKNCRDLTAPEDKDRNDQSFKEAIKNDHTDNFIKDCIVKDGKRVSVNISISLLPDKKRLLLSLKDISNLKLLEEQSRLVSMGEMIGNIAHQWRQPLSIITTNISGLKLKSEFENITSDDIEECNNNILKQANYLSNTIDNFKNFIKGENISTSISLKDVVKSTLTLVKASLDNNYIKLILDIDDDMKFFGNSNELIEAFINIINNSKDILKIKNEEDRFLFIATKKLEGNKINLLICDSGGGIQDDIIEKLFIPYFTTKHQSIGTGLGLSIVDKIIRERHKGTITVYNKEFEHNSNLYKGACFSIVFDS